MIAGRVRGEIDAVIPITVRSRLQSSLAIDAVVDTGFDGFLSLPPNSISSLALLQTAEVFVQLANGCEDKMRGFEAEVDWDETRISIEVAEVDCEPLIGMRMMRGFRLTVDVLDNGTVTVERLDR